MYICLLTFVSLTILNTLAYIYLFHYFYNRYLIHFAVLIASSNAFSNSGLKCFPIVLFATPK